MKHVHCAVDVTAVFFRSLWIILGLDLLEAIASHISPSYT